MIEFSNITVQQLKRAVEIKEQIESLQSELNALMGGAPSTPAPSTASAPSAPRAAGAKKGGMTAAGRARIAAAQKLRWAKAKGLPIPAASAAPVAASQPGSAPKRKMSAAGRARISAAAKARWAKYRANS